MPDGHYFEEIAGEARALDGQKDEDSWRRRTACLLELEAGGLTLADFPRQEESNGSRAHQASLTRCD